MSDQGCLALFPIINAVIAPPRHQVIIRVRLVARCSIYGLEAVALHSGRPRSANQAPLLNSPYVVLIWYGWNPLDDGSTIRASKP